MGREIDGSDICLVLNVLYPSEISTRFRGVGQDRDINLRFSIIYMIFKELGLGEKTLKRKTSPRTNSEVLHLLEYK